VIKEEGPLVSTRELLCFKGTRWCKARKGFAQKEKSDVGEENGTYLREVKGRRG